MAVTIVATAKSTTANSYVTLAEAEAYILGRTGNTTWDAASNDTKNRALVESTNRLETEEYRGSQTTTTQRLQWPRMGLVDKAGNGLDDDTIPRLMKEATYELALALVNGDIEMKDSGLEAFNNVKIGPMDVTPNHARRAGTIPQAVRRLLSDFWLGRSGMNIPIVRG